MAIGLSSSDLGSTSLWLAVIASGAYHGLNPAMGWPLAVSAALMGRGSRDMWVAMAWLAAGHLLSMTAVLLPFAVLGALLAWQRPVQILASGLLIAFGAYLLVRRRHPRALARLKPGQLGLWSFAVATAHGAGLMLVPIYLGLCGAEDLPRPEAALSELVAGNLVMMVAVSLVHGLTVAITGGLLAWLVYRYLGLAFLSRGWFNLEAFWALSLVAVGALALASTLLSPHGM